MDVGSPFLCTVCRFIELFSAFLVLCRTDCRKSSFLSVLHTKIKRIESESFAHSSVESPNFLAFVLQKCKLSSVFLHALFELFESRDSSQFY